MDGWMDLDAICSMQFQLFLWPVLVVRCNIKYKTALFLWPSPWGEEKINQQREKDTNGTHFLIEAKQQAKNAGRRCRQSALLVWMVSESIESIVERIRILSGWSGELKKFFQFLVTFQSHRGSRSWIHDSTAILCWSWDSLWLNPLH